MTTAKVNIKFLQNPLNNQHIEYIINKNGVPISTVGKTFKTNSVTSSSRIARIVLADMVIDGTFNAGSGFNTSAQSHMAIAEQTDGKIIVGGYFTTYNGTSVNRIVRLNPNGTIDTTFNIGIGFNGGVEDIKIQADGKILVCGFFNSYNGTTKNRIVRLNANGSIDSGFSIGSGFNYQADRIAIQSDGKILVGGQFLTYNGSIARGLCRLNTNGSLDTGFNSGGLGTYDSGTSSVAYDVFGLEIQSDGKIMICGFFPKYNGTTVNGICRVNTNGTLDTSFVMGTGFGGTNRLARNLKIQSDDKILVTGMFTSYNGSTANRLIRINTDGTIDGSFDAGTGLNDNGGQYISLQTDGKLIVGGEFSMYDGTPRQNIVRINTNGTIDNNDGLSFNAKVVRTLISSTKIYALGAFLTTTSLALSTSSDIPIGTLVTDTENLSQSNLTTFNSTTGITYTITGDTVQVNVDYDETVDVLTLTNVIDVPFFVIITFDDGLAEPIGDLVFTVDSSFDASGMLNPAYNNTIIRYQTTITNLVYSELIINGQDYKIYPFNNGFTFNFKEIAKTLINPNYFKDTINPDISVASIYDDTTLSLTLPVEIKVVDSFGEFLSANKTFVFLKNVEQLPNYNDRLAASQPVRLLLPTNNFTDYYMPYFEGYPSDFGVFGIQTNDQFYIKNISNYNQTDVFTGTTTEAKRFFISDGQSETSFIEDLNLASNQNKLELWVNDEFKCNLIINKKESKCGVYLKWFNTSGGYSYWLFDEPNTDTISFKSMDDIEGVYDNLQNVSSTSNIIGKKGERRIKLKTKYTTQEKEYLQSLLASPKVEMYAYNQPFVAVNSNSFIGVIAEGSFPYKNKNSNNTLELTITLPEINTQTL